MGGQRNSSDPFPAFPVDGKSLECDTPEEAWEAEQHQPGNRAYWANAR